ncbi:MAG: hypothetical protein BWK73_49755 [Thiothrix lacustris]|uniref:Uncharacterized protein n=1 Tax=Thiothrix lacustris TaxID=525917 RepID=A0A1Y1Q8X8_9GAMM|nr:MAG: hypothetical protein BWK73_49755 [Thiothrix lacustris]
MLTETPTNPLLDPAENALLAEIRASQAATDPADFSESHDSANRTTHPENALQLLMLMIRLYGHYVLVAVAFGTYLYAALLPIAYGGYFTPTNITTLPALLMVGIILGVAFIQCLEEAKAKSSLLSIIAMMASGYISAGVHA